LKIALLAPEKAAIEKRHTDDPEAYNLYLKGLYFTYRPSPEALNKALDYFRKAIDADPNFALAYAGMANDYANFAILSLVSPAEVLPKAKTAFQKALALDNLLAEAHFLTAYIAFWYEWNWETTERSYERALALNPGNALVHATYAYVCLAQRRFEEAVKEIKLAQNLDPLLPLFYAFSVCIHYSVGKPDEAISEFPKAIEMDPHSGLAYFHVGVAYFLKGENEKAISAFKKSKELAVYAGWADGLLGLIHISEGDREKAERILDEMLAQKKSAYVSSMSIGWLWGALGNFDRAFEYFDKAREERDTLMPFVHIFTKIHVPEIQKDPRFKALLKKMKLDED
jgi:tetratricopeptide (TPR) repeat protein